jgi:CHAT domain-containing protein/Flp pilus assembly protein TadD
MRLLVEAYSKARVVEPRLSGGFKWSGFFNSDASEAKAPGEEIEEARDLIEKEALGTGSPEALHAYGRLLTLEGKLNEAAGRLRKVISVQSRNAQAINDLGVCFFQQGNLDDALEQFEQALEISPEFREAAFNHALCYERLLLPQAAIAEFERVAITERDTGWSKEARVRIENLSRPPEPKFAEDEVKRSLDTALAERDMGAARKIASENYETLTKYALLDLALGHLNAAISGDSIGSESALTKIEAIGRLSIETRGDRYIADSAEYLRKLSEKDRPAELALINDYVKIIDASNSHDEDERRAAFTRLARLAEDFRARGNLMRAERAEIRVAKHRYQSNRLRECIDILNVILPLAEQNQWLYERADIYAHLGISYGRMGQHNLALKLFGQAISILEAADEDQLEAKSLQFRSVIYKQLGRLDLALADYRESLQLTLTAAPRPVELAFTYFDLANLYRQWGKHKLALLYAERALSFAEIAGDYNRSAQIHSLMGLEQLALQQQGKADESLNKSISLLSAVDSGQRAYTEPLVYIQAGQAVLQTACPEKAIEYFTRAERIASKAEDGRLLLIRALTGRSGAYAAVGDADLARSDVTRAMNLIESYRAGIAESKYRSSFLEASQNAYDQAIALSLTSFGKPAEAFNISELARGRSLLDEIELQQKGPPDQNLSVHSILDKVSPPLKLDQVQRSLPEKLILVEYSVSVNQTYIFVVTRSGLKVTSSPASAELLDSLVQHYLSALRSPARGEQHKEQARVLYHFLIEPIRDQIPPDSRICIVPDKALHFLPFPALVDDNGDYLIKTYELSTAPSASVLAHCISEEKKKMAQERERILAVGNPKFDQQEYDNLNSLHHAEREAIESSSFYTDDTTLIGEEATESRVVAAMKECDVAHLALHCLVEEKSPWLAALVLARSKPDAQQAGSAQALRNDDGVLQLNELYDIKLPRTRLVVLSACQSALGQYYRGEGIVSLVRPFISSGVPTVVASLWPVHEQATARLMTDFHRHRKQSDNKVSEALRAAQISMSSGGPFEHPYYWAPFVAIGSAD